MSPLSIIFLYSGEKKTTTESHEIISFSLLIKSSEHIKLFLSKITCTFPPDFFSTSFFRYSIISVELSQQYEK